MHRALSAEQILAFLKEQVPPIENEHTGPRYRAAVRLTDDTLLPCVVFESERHQVDLALRRFEETRRFPAELRQVVAAFVTSGNRLSVWDIAAVEVSPFALAPELLGKIRGETSMSWTGFDAILRDGRRLPMGTLFSFEFFDLPQGVVATDVVRIEQVGEPLAPGLPPFIPRPTDGPVFRELPFFTCYLAGL